MWRRTRFKRNDAIVRVSAPSEEAENPLARLTSRASQANLTSDADDPLARAFTARAIDEGVYLHPFHNMFLCAAHTEADIDEALDGTERAFASMRADGVGLG